MITKTTCRFFARPVDIEFDNRRLHEDTGRVHQYVTHKTYTGKGCAMCGKPESDKVHFTAVSPKVN
jgi:hypothetical protein